MSIASEITRLQSAKSDIKAAIEGKGVTVSSSATFDDYASLISSIATGGSSGGSSLPSGITAVDFGTITISSAFTTTRQTFTHNLGTTPDLVMVWTSSNIATTYSMLCAIRFAQFGWRSSTYTAHYAYHGNSTTTVAWGNTSNANYGVSNLSSTSFQLSSHSTSYYWRAGSYKYIAIKFT